MDIADEAQDYIDFELSLSLSRIPKEIPKGEPGECIKCGEDSPRLIKGECAFCRDGRKR